MSADRNRIFGVDFSGSRTPARKIWISEAIPKSNSLEINDCRPAIERFDLHVRPERDEVYRELKKLVRTHPSALFGFDFPFSLPEPLIDDVGSWRDHLEKFDQRLGHKSADEFRKICVGRAAVKAGESGYLRRETDWRYGGQCPYQHQIVYQCCYGQRDFLAPLITNDEARALPMQTPSKGLPWLIEVYPAATLSRLGLYRQGCKNHSGSEERRTRNVEGMRQEGVQLSASIADRCRKSDDAHDSLTAAVGTFRALKMASQKILVGQILRVRFLLDPLMLICERTFGTGGKVERLSLCTLSPVGKVGPPHQEQAYLSYTTI